MQAKKFVEKISNKFESTSRSGIINMCLKPVGMILSLVYTPLLLNYLGDIKYGLWVTMLSIINWVNYFDVGIGNGLRNVLTKEIAKEDFANAKKSISTGYVVLTAIAGLILAVLIVLSLVVNWHSVFSTEIDMRITMIISFAFICINLVLALSNTILYALQMSERVALRGCIVQLINIIGLKVISLFSSGNIEYMAILFGTSTMSVYIYNTISILKGRRELLPQIALFERQKVGEIANIGIKFFVIQIMCLLLFTVDNLIITHYFGAEQVTPFSIANKVFNTAFTLFAAFVVPFWSRSTVAFDQKDIQWIKKCMKQVFAMSGIFMVGYVEILLILKPVVKIWLGREILFDAGLPEIMCVFYCLYTVMSAECQFINGSGKINVQLIVYIIIGILNVPLSIYLGVNLGMGVVGVRLATTILVGAEAIILAFNLKHIVEETKNNLGGTLDVSI